MPGFMITVTSNNKWWYLLGAVLFLLAGIAIAIAGFTTLGTSWGITGIVVGVVSVVFLIDAIMNL